MNNLRLPSKNSLLVPSPCSEVVFTSPRRGAAGVAFRHKKAVSDNAIEGQSEEDIFLAHKRPYAKDAETKKLVITGIKKDRFCRLLEEPELDAIFEAMEYCVFEAGDTVVRQSDVGTHFFVSHEGTLQVLVDGVVRNTFVAGSAFGAIALLYNCPCTATVVATEHVGVWLVAGDVLRGVLRTYSQSRREENQSFLDSVHLFDGLPDALKDRVAQSALSVTIDKGTPVITEGDTVTALRFVRRGEMSAFTGGTLDSSGSLIGGTRVSQLTAGDHFGERGILYGELHYYTVIAETLCELVCVGLQQLREILGSDVTQCLEQGFALSILRTVPVISQLKRTTLFHIAQAMTASSYKPGESVKGSKQLVIVMEGEVIGKAKDETVTLLRGECCGEGALAELAGAGSNAKGENAQKRPRVGLTGLKAGDSGARVLTLAKQDLAKALKGLGLTALNSTEQAEDRLRKTLLAKKVPILSAVSEEQVNKFVSCFVLRKYTKGARVIEQGEFGRAFYVVANGEMSVVMNDQHIRVLGCGTCFGERALLLDERRSATVEVSSNVAELWSVDRTDFQKIVTERMHEELVHRIKLQDTTVTMKSLANPRLIGVGGFGSVHVVDHRWASTRYALKCVKMKDGQVPDDLRRECALLAEMDHPFIMRLVQTFEVSPRMFILTELITGGSLYEQMETLGVLSREQARFYISSLVLVLEALHDRNIVYRDLKPENVMLDSQGYLKLIDFGFAKKLDRASNKTFTLSGTIFYMAPEAVRGKGYGTEADIWALGVFCYELTCGRMPFGEDCPNDSDTLAAILNKELEFPEGYDDVVGKEFMQGMMSKFPGGRLGAGKKGWDEVKASGFFELEEEVPGGIFAQVMGRELTAPYVPNGEEFPDEAVVQKQAAAGGIDVDGILGLLGSSD